jgi:DNA-binding SARP family transcriptional activator
VRYEILGPLRVIDGATQNSVRGRKVETLLTVLLACAGEVVTHDQLISEIWGERPPRRVTAGLHVYVSQLRKLLGDGSGMGASPIVTRPPGYLLNLGDNELDAQLFLQLADDGRQLLRDRRFDTACDVLEGALSLWRGRLLDDTFAGPILAGYAVSLDEVRLECDEMLVEARLQLGRHRELIAPLYGLIARHPLREAFYRQLMLALYRSERTADALRVFQSARRVLREELGLEPCRALQDLQRMILAADGRLDCGTAVAARAA